MFKPLYNFNSALWLEACPQPCCAAHIPVCSPSTAQLPAPCPAPYLSMPCLPSGYPSSPLRRDIMLVSCRNLTLPSRLAFALDWMCFSFYFLA